MKTTPEQSVASLRLWLFERSLHPELFDIQRRWAFAQDGYEGHLWATTDGHVVSLFAGRAAITQAIAPQNAILPVRSRLFSQGFGRDKAFESHTTDGLTVKVHFQAERMTPRVYQKTHDELLKKGQRCGMLVEFGDGAHAPAPFCYFHLDHYPDHLHLLAFHAFPEERTLIKAQTLFEWEHPLS